MLLSPMITTLSASEQRVGRDVCYVDIFVSGHTSKKSVLRPLYCSFCLRSRVGKGKVSPLQGDNKGKLQMCPVKEATGFPLVPEDLARSLLLLPTMQSPSVDTRQSCTVQHSTVYSILL